MRLATAFLFLGVCLARSPMPRPPLPRPTLARPRAISCSRRARRRSISTTRRRQARPDAGRGQVSELRSPITGRAPNMMLQVNVGGTAYLGAAAHGQIPLRGQAARDLPQSRDGIEHDKGRRDARARAKTARRREASDAQDASALLALVRRTPAVAATAVPGCSTATAIPAAAAPSTRSIRPPTTATWSRAVRSRSASCARAAKASCRRPSCTPMRKA